MIALMIFGCRSMIFRVASIGRVAKISSRAFSLICIGGWELSQFINSSGRVYTGSSAQSVTIAYNMWLVIVLREWIFCIHMDYTCIFWKRCFWVVFRRPPEFCKIWNDQNLKNRPGWPETVLIQNLWIICCLSIKKFFDKSIFKRFISRRSWLVYFETARYMYIPRLREHFFFNVSIFTFWTHRTGAVHLVRTVKTP